MTRKHSKKSNKSGSAEKTIKDIRRATRRNYGAEEKIRIVLEGLRGEHSIAELCRLEGITKSLLLLVQGLSGSGQEAPFG